MEKDLKMTVNSVLCDHSKVQQQDPKIMDIQLNGTQEEMRQELMAKGLKEVPGENYLEGTYNHEKVALVLCTNNAEVWGIVLVTCDERDAESLKVLLNQLNDHSEKLYKKFLMQKENKCILDKYFGELFSLQSKRIKEDEYTYRIFPHTLSFKYKKNC